jgi:hypothetical protein
MPYALDEVPRGLGEEEHATCKDNGVGELHSNRDSVCELG